MDKQADPAFQETTTKSSLTYRAIPGLVFGLCLLAPLVAPSAAIPEHHHGRHRGGDENACAVNFKTRRQGEKETRGYFFDSENHERHVTRYVERAGAKESLRLTQDNNLFTALPTRRKGEKETRRWRPQVKPVVDLRGKAAFMPSDDPIFRSKYIDESLEWNFIPVPGAWERHGYANLDGIAWYRFRFRLTPEQRKDSLVVIMSAIDDADQTFLNSAPIGATGAFPPVPRSEWATPRVYDLPDSILEEYNSLAVRVYDRADSGGIRGAVLGIYRKRDADRVLAYPDPVLSVETDLHLLNGSGIAVYSPVLNAVTAWYPHVYSALDPGLPTENILSRAGFRFSRGDSVIRLAERHAVSNRYLEQSSIVQTTYSIDAATCETFWFLPAQTTLKILVGMLQLPAGWDADNVGLEMTMLTPNFAFREFVKSSGASIDYYFVIAYNGCCVELAQRDLDRFLAEKPGDLAPPYSVERQMMEAGAVRAQMRVPDLLTDQERVLYRQSVTFLLGAQNRETGLGFGQIVSGAMPASQRWAEPIDHFFSAWALAKAGFPNRSRQALDFAFAQGRDAYRFVNVGGENYGVGFNYRVTPGKWYGSGREFTWNDPSQAPLSMLGTALGIIAYDSWLQAEQRRRAPDAVIADSILLAPDWEILSRQVADVLLYRLENNLMPKDAGCWDKTLSARPNIVTSLYSAAALRIASAYAALMHDNLRRYLYARGARSIIAAIDSLAATLDTTSVHDLDVVQLRLFDPLLVDGISLDLFRRDSPARAFAFDALEKSFRLDDGPWYLARPNGDWYDRRAHPFITLHLATAAARAGMNDSAERLFSAVVRMAGKLYNQVPELYDPETGGAYGGIPSAGRGAAAFILASWEINALRLRLERLR